MHRALGYRYPLKTSFGGKDVYLIELEPFDGLTHESAPPGTLNIKEGRLYIKCIQGWIHCTCLKFAGKTAIGVKDFVNGYKPKSLMDSFSGK